MVGGENGRSIQVLNMSNVNAQGLTVLNDGKLLELIQTYPFLYNPRVRAYGDPDYTMWAWKRINAAFNRSYENDPSAAFSVADLMDRWNVLKPLIQCLSKVYDLQAIPSSLRQSVLQISTELEDQTSNFFQKSNTPLQNLLTQNMSEIGKLPLAKRLALETEILELLLNTELEHKQYKKLTDADIDAANQEADEFLNDIGFKQVLQSAFSQQSKMYSNDVKTVNGTTGFVSKDSKGTLIPLGEAHKYIRRCYVPIKRMNMEDYVPLSKIRKICSRK